MWLTKWFEYKTDVAKTSCAEFLKLNFNNVPCIPKYFSQLYFRGFHSVGVLMQRAASLDLTL